MTTPTKTALKLLFACIFFAMAACTGWAAMHQAVWAWTGLTNGPDRFWTLATFFDAYCGFLIFYCWVFYKEAGWLPRAAWFALIMLFGNMAMSAYVLIQLFKLRPQENVADLLLARRR